MPRRHSTERPAGGLPPNPRRIAHTKRGRTAFRTDKLKDDKKSKVILMFAENTLGSAGQADQNCWLFP